MLRYIRKPGSDYPADEVWADHPGFSVMINYPSESIQFTIEDFIVVHRENDGGFTSVFMASDFFEKNFAPCPKHESEK